MTRTTRFTRSLTGALALVALATLLALGGLSLAGCGSTAATSSVPAENPASAFPVTVTDDASRTVTLKSEPQRIVSLAPANTEMLYALGLGDRVVGVTTYDDYPAEVAKVAKVGDFAAPNIESVAAAKPDLVLATSGVQADVVAKLEDLGATVLVIDPQTLTQVYTDIERLGSATAKTDVARQLVADMKAKVAAVEEAVKGKPAVTTFVEIGQNPLYTVGNGTLIDELVTLAGGKNVVTEPGYVAYSNEQLLAADPQVYMATKGSMSDPAQLAQRAGFDKLAAVKNGRVVILDDNLVSRPGPRVVEGLDSVARALHPDAFGQ